MKTKNISVFIIMLISLCFSVIYIMSNVGYYEYSNNSKKVYTEEQIKKFEEDIKNGVSIDATNYVDIDNVEKKEQLSLKINKFVGRIFRYLIKQIFKLLNKVVEI